MAARYISILFFIFSSFPVFAQEITVKGQVFDKDSITPMQFAYVVNKNSSTGIVSDEKGNFTLKIKSGDTLCFSYVGYLVTKVFTHLVKDSIRNGVLNVKAYLKPKATELSTVMITSHGFSKEQKEMYQRKINEYHSAISSAFSSPISALYYTFSKKGKELQKLSKLYDQLMIDEIKESRLSPERVRNITGNDTLNVKEFLNSCFIPDQLVASGSDYDLFFAVNKCYKQYMDNRKEKK